jgi:hypothetical protein
MQVPTGSGQGRRDVFGADIPFTEILFHAPAFLGKKVSARKDLALTF